MGTTTVREVLERDHVVSVDRHATVRAAARLMHDEVCGSVLVIEDGRLAGIFTERDLLMRVVAIDRDVDGTDVGAVMTRDPDHIAADRPVKEAIRLMDECGYRHLPVVDGSNVIGVLSAHHLPLAELWDMREELDKRHGLTERMR